MFSLSTIVVSLLFLAIIYQTNCLQCYKCSCIVIPGETTCTDENELQCVIEYVENNYCTIIRQPSDLQFGHKSNSDLTFLESLHYIRAKEKIVYLESSSTWQSPTVVEFAYGCDWNLCNTPRILDLLPNGLTFNVSSSILTDALIAQSGEIFSTCLSCTKCVNSSSGITCQTPTCSGTCLIDDHLDDPVVNSGSCNFAFESVCLSEILDTSVQITGTYYIDDDIFGITEIDIWCRRTNCNDPTHAQVIQSNTKYTTQINDQLYFRPNINTTPKPTDNLLGCYQCYCEREIGSNDCRILECTIEYKNGSYCEIVRDFKSSSDKEIIRLGHVQRTYVPYKHFIYAEEELIFYKNLTWHPASISLISYICDWELCNDGRLVEKLPTSFQFNADPSKIAEYIQSPEPLSHCLSCSMCTNSSLDFDKCGNVSCPSTGRCFIDEYIDDPQFDDCEYAFLATCERDVSESSIIIAATYDIDDDKFEFDEIDLYCAKNDCNNPLTVNSLMGLIEENIQLDPLFFIRPVMNTTTQPPITEPVPETSSSTTKPVPETTRVTTTLPPNFATSNSITIISLFFLMIITFLISQ